MLPDFLRLSPRPLAKKSYGDSREEPPAMMCGLSTVNWRLSTPSHAEYARLKLDSKVMTFVVQGI
jgi:hypothetical protein